VGKHYNHHEKKSPKEGLKGKVGLVVSLVAFLGAELKKKWGRTSWIVFIKK